MTSELTAGRKIYRPARVARMGRGCQGYQVIMETPAMQHFDDSTVMLRAVPDKRFHPDWVVAPWGAEGGRVCVCDEPITDGWTHFEVIFADVNFVAVAPVAGDMGELKRKHLEVFRLAQGK